MLLGPIVRQCFYESRYFHSAEQWVGEWAKVEVRVSISRLKIKYLMFLAVERVKYHRTEQILKAHSAVSSVSVIEFIVIHGPSRVLISHATNFRWID